jgi:hypothetical protein
MWLVAVWRVLRAKLLHVRTRFIVSVRDDDLLKKKQVMISYLFRAQLLVLIRLLNIYRPVFIWNVFFYFMPWKISTVSSYYLAMTNDFRIRNIIIGINFVRTASVV